jgi:hypothetical protein
MGGIENYTDLCAIQIDLSHLPLLPLSKYSGGGTCYYFEYEIVLLFGLTELQAVVAWKENVGPPFVFLHRFAFTECFQGVERRSPARIIYDPNLTNDDP